MKTYKQSPLTIARGASSVLYQQPRVWPVLSAAIIVPTLLAALLLSAPVAVATAPELTQNTQRVAWYTVNVVETKPFDRNNFIQGLEFHQDLLYVSSGLYGVSAIKRYRWPEAKLFDSVALPKHLFAEGITRIGDHLLVLTWRARQLLVLDADTLIQVGSTALPGEGWGITHNNNTVYFSDGSHQLYRFQIGGDGALTPIPVTLNGKPVTRLNELEWINGEIWANVWQTDQIVRIAPETGQVTGVVNLTGLLPDSERRADTDVLNGIAYNPQDGSIWVTGKRWPMLFRIELVSATE